MKNITVSLIIPAYNEEGYIGECLDYVIKNSNGKFSEIIVIDNASTDRTAEIAGKYPEVRVVHEPKKGLTYARQCGFENAKGDVLAYIDADTRMPPFWYENIVNEFLKDENLACLSGPYIYHDVSKFKKFLIKIIYWYILAMPTYWMVGYMVTGANFAIRRDILEKMGGFDTSIEFYGEDTNIARRAHMYGKVKFKPQFSMPLSGRRLNKQGFLKTAFFYMINYLSEVFFYKPRTRNYKDYR
jgi:glycosyltransferase involved in cell wall biosynthesis